MGNRVSGRVARAAVAAALVLAGLAVALSLSAVSTRQAFASSNSSYGFSDVAGDEWFANDDILGYATEKGLLKGYDDGRFGPHDEVTRGQVAVILYRVAGEPSVSSSVKSFDDVKSGAYYSRAVRWAYSEGVINGYSDTTGGSHRFGPDDPATREQFCGMLARYIENVVGFSVAAAFCPWSARTPWARARRWAPNRAPSRAPRPPQPLSRASRRSTAGAGASWPL